MLRATSATGIAARWVFAWGGAAAIGVANGALRNAVYRKSIGDLAAHQVSTGTLLLALFAYSWLLQRRWPLDSDKQALGIGVIWATLAIAFESGFGAARGQAWQEVTADYDLAAGRVWGLVPTFMAVAPWVVRRLQLSRQEPEAA